MDPNYSEIGSRIREQREYLGLSRECVCRENRRNTQILFRY